MERAIDNCPVVSHLLIGLGLSVRQLRCGEFRPAWRSGIGANKAFPTIQILAVENGRETMRRGILPLRFFQILDVYLFEFHRFRAVAQKSDVSALAQHTGV